MGERATVAAFGSWMVMYVLFGIDGVLLSVAFVCAFLILMDILK